MSVTINGSGAITFNDGSVQNTASLPGMRNRLINGAMMIDQRNAGASVTVTGGSIVYTLDRWVTFEDTDGICAVQQISDAPAGFVNSLRFTTTTADASLGVGQRALIQQRIEGFNTADLAWGTASASTITVSFWVKSSLTGTFGGSIANRSASRAYPFTYTISSANTWEQKSITIVGDTTGTWLTNNGIGLILNFGLGVGSTYSATAGAWATGDFNSATGATSVIGTLNATWQITGVQLEKGSTATSFDYRPYGQELALCQRYYQIGLSGAAGRWNNSTTAEVAYSFRTQMRAAPTVTHLSNYSASEIGVAGRTITNTTISGITEYGGLINIISSGATTGSIAGVTGSGAGFSAEL